LGASLEFSSKHKGRSETKNSGFAHRRRFARPENDLGLVRVVPAAAQRDVLTPHGLIRFETDARFVSAARAVLVANPPPWFRGLAELGLLPFAGEKIQRSLEDDPGSPF